MIFVLYNTKTNVTLLLLTKEQQTTLRATSSRHKNKATNVVFMIGYK
jgi:hypothetical protein